MHERPAARLAVPVSVARVEVRSVPYEIAATGAVEPIRSANVTSQVSGMLRLRRVELHRLP